MCPNTPCENVEEQRVSWAEALYDGDGHWVRCVKRSATMWDDSVLSMYSQTLKGPAFTLTGLAPSSD